MIPMYIWRLIVTTIVTAIFAIIGGVSLHFAHISVPVTFPGFLSIMCPFWAGASAVIILLYPSKRNL